MFVKTDRFPRAHFCGKVFDVTCCLDPNLFFILFLFTFNLYFLLFLDFISTIFVFAVLTFLIVHHFVYFLCAFLRSLQFTNMFLHFSTPIWQQFQFLQIIWKNFVIKQTCYAFIFLLYFLLFVIIISFV